MRFPDAVQRETLHRRSGIVPSSAFITVPVLQRVTFVPRCARDMQFEA
jgi:hypothetical protein